MEDVLTETAPPSRFLEEDLDNFATPSPPLPHPFILLSPDPNPIPYLLLIAISPPSLALLHRIPGKTLIGALIVPETPLSGTALVPSPRDRSIDIYAVDNGKTVLVAVQYPIPAERAKAVARAVVRGLTAERVVVLDSIKRGNYRGRLTGDEAVGVKLETAEQRREGGGVAMEWMPEGSVVDGLGAAVMGECQMRRIKGTLCVTWPDQGRPSVVPLLGTVMKGLGLDVDVDVAGVEGELGGGFDLDLYS
ncbi:hypothetical protein J5N97_007705 [Dioscorea zingiberensis]|uniref:Uncharacterized protein n=1 Tax=Dioscorea zingiberensis TaxID=325984 RepID=A0A9D5DDN9_9LILI|nr:hypothetical protein J5N97_007705 [Dioscorea zingiberensis]